MACHTAIQKFIIYTQGQYGNGFLLMEHYERFKGLRDMVEQARNSFNDMEDIADQVHKEGMGT